MGTTWEGDGPYSQAVTIANISANDKVDIQPGADVLRQLIADGTRALWMFPFLYNDHIVLTDESLELTAFGDGSPEAPFGFPRYEDNDIRGVELWLEDCADQFDNDGDTPGWEETKAEFEREQGIAAERKYIDKLRRHGAKIIVDGQPTEIDSNLWDKAVNECLTKGFKAIAYELRIPETEDKLLLAVYADGHVDSGSEEIVLHCMENHWGGQRA